jgi:hypothetical protein
MTLISKWFTHEEVVNAISYLDLRHPEILKLLDENSNSFTVAELIEIYNMLTMGVFLYKVSKDHKRDSDY